MDFIRDTMALTPKTWDKSFQYTNKRYITVDLEEDSEEFTSVARDFRGSGHPITIFKGIKRIQHPFAYARYNLHKEYLQAVGYTVQERTVYTLCDAEKADIYIDYNCDHRRGTSGYTRNTIYIRTKKIVDHYLGDRDSNTYPEYIIVVGEHCAVQ